MRITEFTFLWHFPLYAVEGYTVAQAVILYLRGFITYLVFLAMRREE